MKKALKYTILLSALFLTSTSTVLATSKINSEVSLSVLQEMEAIEDNATEISRQFEEEADAQPIQPDSKNFSRAASGTWSWRDVVICVTTEGFGNEIINTWHAGIVAPQQPYVVAEAPKKGVNVRLRSGEWSPSKGYTVYQVGVNSTSVQQDWNAGNWAGKQVGKPYNTSFWDAKRTDKFYCSQLVWAAYYYTAGVNLNKSSNDVQGKMAIHPGEFVTNPNTTVIYKNAR